MSENINIFEQASRVELRFPFRNCGVGDLWNLSVQQLDGIFQVLNTKLKAEKEESLLGPKSGETSELGLQVAIIRHIVGVKLAEAAAAETREVRRQQNARIDGIIAGKQEDKLRGMTEAELLQLREDV